MMLFPFIAQASPSQSMNHFQTFRGSWKNFSRCSAILNSPALSHHIFLNNTGSWPLRSWKHHRWIRGRLLRILPRWPHGKLDVQYSLGLNIGNSFSALRTNFTF
jgi:hypothetical protein